MSNQFTYPTTEKLKSKKLLDEVFASKTSFLIHPLKFFYITTDISIYAPIQVGAGVSSRFFKNATDRNRVKRLLREAYRLNKLPLHEAIANKSYGIAVFILYVGKELPTLLQIMPKMKEGLDKTIVQINKIEAFN